MIIEPELRTHIDDIAKRAGYLWRYLDVEGKEKRIAELETVMSQPTFWDSQETAQKTISESNLLKGAVKGIVDYQAKVEDLQALAELVDESEDDAELMAELQGTVDELLKEIDGLEIQSFLSGPMDNNAAILSVHAGAGGTESCDWADMLLRQYTRWAERRGFAVEILDISPGEEAGISSASLRIVGPYAYGYSKAERGVHRLVRISPFDSNKRRHTSFSSVDVIAEVADDIDIEIKDDDLRVDTYRASGKGGQHVNKTDSAVRMTHLPTGIVVQCQNERSQLKNRASAMKQLKSRLYEYEQDKKRSEMEKFYGEKGEIGWGNQIRSYVFQPYQMVKDLRTGVETGNIQAVQDGELDPFIHAWLRAGCPTSRNKDVKVED
ncbi:MAG: peptide chain release factor 2 [Verrucomicrobiota bacterium]